MKGRRKRRKDEPTMSQDEGRSRRKRRGTPETDDGETDLDNNGRRRKRTKSSKKSKSKVDEMENFLEQFNAEDSEYLGNEEEQLIEPVLEPLVIRDEDDNYIDPLSYRKVKEW
jgi:hypothetical protein